jgi:hypothetical protein
LNEGRRKKEEGRRFIYVDTEPQLKTGDPEHHGVLKRTRRIISSSRFAIFQIN